MTKTPPSNRKRLLWRAPAVCIRTVMACVVVAVTGIATLAIGTSSALAATHDDSLSGVSCIGPSSCVAVGLYQRNNVQYALAEHWNGHTWSLLTVPNNAQSYLSAVSCTAATSCWAMGNPNNGIEQLQGTKWKAVATPGITGLMYGISCSNTPEGCTAVGTEYVPMGDWGAVTEQWNKPGAWYASGSVSSSTTNPYNTLNGVSCTNSSNCMAVGTQEYIVSFNGSNIVWGYEPLVGAWDGSGWTSLTAPSVGTDSGLNAVSCDTPTDCLAVGYNGTAALVEQWNGSAWSIVSSPGTAALTGVSCVSSTFSAAVGDASLAKWNGTSWSVANSQTGSGAFDGVSCTSTSNCMAVGGSGATLTARWNGKKWSTIPSPNR